MVAPKTLFYIANWKMSMPFSAAVNFCQSHLKELRALTAQATIIVCPSFPALHTVAQLCANTSIKVGAQDCSAYEQGPFTGQVDAQSLAQAGCTYGIIGHSERRSADNETEQVVAQKMAHLIAANLTPIVCIGESAEQRSSGITYQSLQKQLDPIMSILKQSTASCIIAYEPRWAVGARTPADTKTITSVITWLRTMLASYTNHNKILLAYGGSVTDSSISSLKQETDVDGFLIGAASLNFQTLQKIVLSPY